MPYDTETAYDKAYEYGREEFLGKLAASKDEAEKLIALYEWSNEQLEIFHKTACVIAAGGTNEQIGALVRPIFENILHTLADDYAADHWEEHTYAAYRAAARADELRG